MKEIKQRITFEDFVKEVSALKGKILDHVDPYYQKIDLHFDSYILYVSGFWEVLNSGKIELDESFPQSTIIDFFNQQISTRVISIQFFEDSLEVFFELSNKRTLHFVSEKKGRWIELVKRTGELITVSEDGTYFRKFL